MIPTLVATIRFSPFACCFRSIRRRAFAFLLRNEENAKFTQSRLGPTIALRVFSGYFNLPRIFWSLRLSETTSKNAPMKRAKWHNFSGHFSVLKVISPSEGHLPKLTLKDSQGIHYLNWRVNGSLIAPITFTDSPQSEVPQKFPRLPWKFPGFPEGQPLSLGSLTPCPDSLTVDQACWPKELTRVETLKRPKHSKASAIGGFILEERSYRT